MSAAALCLFCGCEKGNVPTEAVSAEVSEITEVTTVPESSESTGSTSERASVTFAAAETEPERTEKNSPEERETETVITEHQLAENQLEYSGRNIYILMEFTGAESLKFYPRAVNLSLYRDDYFVLHSKITVTNISKKSFDFIPQKMVIHGGNKNSGGSMIPISATDTGLVASDSYYTVGAGETVSFDADFVGNEICIDHAYRIIYQTYGHRDYNEINAEELNNASAAEFEITKRSMVKNAIRAARSFKESRDSALSALTPREGEYSVLTHKNSYCFTVEPIVDGKYIKVVLRIQCLTGEPETFRPHRFKLYTATDHNSPYRWNFDASLASSKPEIKNDMEGINDTLYDAPFELSVGADGSAEYTMYFYSLLCEPDEYYKFCYEGTKGEDVFECIINME